MTCEICIRPLEPAEKTVTCGRLLCGKTFHPFCVDLNLTLWNALEAGIGLEWFCAGCRGKSVQPEPEPKSTVDMADLLARIDQLEVKVDAGFASCREQLEVVVGKIGGQSAGRAPIELAGKESRLIHPSIDSVPKIENVTMHPEVIVEKENEVEQSGIIPDKVWLKIFGKLSGYQMTQARLTCRHWNQIIGKSSLMDKLQIKFPKGIILDKSSDEMRGLAASNSRYTKVILEDISIIQAPLWWQPISEHINTISLKKCVMTVADLLEMIRSTPRLKYLTLDVSFHSSYPEIISQAKNLEELTLGESVQHETIALFRKLCPRLKGLFIKQRCYMNEVLNESHDLIISVQSTLESLSLFGEYAEILTRKVSENLRLKTFHTSQISNEFLETFCITQPSLDKINVTVTGNKKISPQYFPKGLIRLEILCNWFDHLTLTESLPQLKHLKQVNHAIRGGKSLKLTHQPTLKHEKIEILEIKYPFETVLCLDEYPNLRSLSLCGISLESFDVVYKECSRLKHLNDLELSNIMTIFEDVYFFDYIENLRVLKLASCNMSERSLNKLFTLIPNLETVSLKSMSDVNDNVIRTLCQKLKRLKSLELAELHNITNDSVEHIIRYCSVIEKVRLRCLGKISEQETRRLKAHRNLQLVEN